MNIAQDENTVCKFVFDRVCEFDYNAETNRLTVMAVMPEFGENKCEKEKRFKEFKDLKIGDKFMFGNLIFLKTESFINDNSVCISDGKKAHFDCNIRVKPVDIDIVSKW